MNYSQMTKKQLRAAFEKDKKLWNTLPNRGGFSALSISGRLNRIQQEMYRRKMKWDELICEVFIEVG